MVISIPKNIITRKKRKPGRGNLFPKPQHSTIPFSVGKTMKYTAINIAHSKQMKISDYATYVIRNILKFVHSHESTLLKKKEAPTRFINIPTTKLSRKEHEYIYKIVQEYKLFESRSAILRFAILMDMFMDLESNNKSGRDSFYDDIMNVHEKEYFLHDSLEVYKVKMDRLKQMFPDRPEYKAINEE